MNNSVLFNNEAINSMKEGIDIGADAISVTLGYGGRTVFINKNGMPLVATKDGVTVVNSIRLKNQAKDAGLKLIQSVSTKTADAVGDGTTSAAVLMREMVSKGVMMRQVGYNIVDVKKGMENACSAVIDKINEMKFDISGDSAMLKNIATVSANNDEEIGELISLAYERIGKYGTMHVEDSNNHETSVEIVEGFEFGSGMLSHYFINTPKNTCELITPYILIVEGKVNKTDDVLPILEMVVAQGRGIVIIAEDFEHYVVADILNNVSKKTLQALLIKYTVSGSTKDELMLDLCAVTGATLVTEKTGKKMTSIDLSWLGECEKVVASKDETTVFNGKKNKEDVELRIEDAETKLADAKNPFIKQKIELRLSKLKGCVAICYVGGLTDVEIGEKKDRIDDAIKATKAALEHGVVCGGGASLLKCISALKRLTCRNSAERAGVTIVEEAIKKPFIQICENAGKNGEVYAEKVIEKKGDFGYNAKSDKIENLIECGIVDPAKVVITCMENSVSGAVQFLISGCAIIDE